jgi:hypothetical protein
MRKMRIKYRCRKLVATMNSERTRKMECKIKRREACPLVLLKLTFPSRIRPISDEAIIVILTILMKRKNAMHKFYRRKWSVRSI